ncbi:MAG TPA: L-arabinose isomerase [Clostridiales bacterium]|nr:L-arabinose isomerase [Clostridiales bacterium]
MKNLKQYDFWFVVGSQHLYGPEVLEIVSRHAAEMAAALDASAEIPCRVVYKATVKSPDEITQVVKDANYDDNCAGIITWMHTFSPSKMWINGLDLLQKPYCHFHTQYNRNIPNEGIDMDFMNLNQAAHGDREHGFIAARLRLPRKIVVGFWQEPAVQRQLGSWMRSAVGVAVSRNLKVMRFGDNMKQVAVTEGDKVEAQHKLGWQVNTWPVGLLVQEIDRVSEQAIDVLMAEYQENYTLATENIPAVRYQARVEIALQKMLDQEGAGAFSNTFEDLYGMEQLPGLATQHLLAKGYGYGGEGDWKTSAMTHIVKAMTQGLPGGSGFMEDYTYDLEPGRELVLGAHMLEVCPTLTSSRPRIEVHPLGIGGKADPARLVFAGPAGRAMMVTLIDMGGRMRLIMHDVEAVEPVYEMPNLPVARVMWKPMPDLMTGAHAWILAGGAHHAVLTFAATADMLKDWAEIMGVEVVHITAETNIDSLKKDLFLADLAYKLKN